MTIFKLAVGTMALALAGSAMGFEIAPLGASTALPLEGGILTLAVAGLVAGIRIIKRNNKR